MLVCFGFVGVFFGGGEWGSCLGFSFLLMHANVTLMKSASVLKLCGRMGGQHCLKFGDIWDDKI